MMTTDDPDNETFDFRSLSDSLENTPDVEAWLNSILDDAHTDGDSQSPADLTALDRHVSNVLASLEIVSQDTSTQLERIIDDISRGAPRLAYDLHFMKEGALSLQNSLHELQQSSQSSGSPEIQAALERLYHLDSIKKQMEAARDVLKDAESWSTLESEILSLLTEQNYEKAAETLSEAAKSMVVFQNTPEYEVRRSLMVSLQNQLEASLSSALVAAINSQDVVVCKSYFSIFSNIQRESEFRNYYYGSRRTSLVTLWQEVRLRDIDAATDATPASSPQTFAAFLPTFYESFLALLEAERLTIPSIFPDPQATLSALISSVLSSIQPPLSQRISSLANHYGSSALTELIASYAASVDFAVATENLMEKITFSVSQTGDEGDSKYARRRSRLSTSRRMGSRASISVSVPGSSKPILSLSDSEWQQELFEPFLDYQVDYGLLEQKFLSDKLDRIVFTESTAAGKSRDGARWLKERSVDVFGLADQSVTRCMNFTHGYGLVGLIQALDHTFKSVIKSSEDDMLSTQSRPTPSEPGSALGGGDDLSDMDYTAQDWSRIQIYLHLLEATKGFHERLVTLENKLRSNLTQIADTLRSAQSDLFVGGRSVSGIARGALQILAQSTLNSMELQELLRSVEPDYRSPLLSAPPTTPRLSQDPAQSVRATLMIGTRAAISSLARTCQSLLQKTILSPLHKHLTSYAGSAMWSSQGDPTSRAPGARGTVNEIHVPVFSISPSDTIQRVAEGLLNLPRLFEVYADDDALSFSIQTLPFVGEDLLKSVFGHHHAHGSGDATSPASPMSSTTGLRRSPSISLRAPIVVPPSAAAAVLTPEAVSAAWLSSQTLSFLAFMTSSVLPSIKTLTAAGAAQLSSDLAYLSNVVQALNIRSVELEKWRELSEMSDEEGRRQVKERDGSNDQVFMSVAKLRGWN